MLKTTNHLSNKKIKHLVLANEGSAVAVYWLSFSKEKFCNVHAKFWTWKLINPLISIAHSKVYKIPLLLIIGWRGAPNLKDEPQHLAKGEITTQILDLCGIKYIILEKNDDLKKLKINQLLKKTNQAKHA